MTYEELQELRRTAYGADIQGDRFMFVVDPGASNPAAFRALRHTMMVAVLEMIEVDPFEQAAENLQQALAKAEGRFENMELCEPIKRTREERMKPNQPFYMTVPKRRKRR